MATTFCDSGAVKLKAGLYVNDDITLAQYEQVINQAESFINVATRINYTDTYSTLNDDTKKLLEMTASDLAAIYIISYDLFSYDIAEATTMQNVLHDRAKEAIKLLEDKKATTFINNS